MSAPSVSTVGIDWTVFSDVKHEMMVVGTPRMIKPFISVECTNLDPTAFYKIGIDFVRPNTKWYGFDIAKQAWLHMKSPEPSEIKDYDNFKWHDSGLQTGKQLMNAVTNFDKLWASAEEQKDTDKRQFVRLQRNFEYVPVIRLLRAVDAANDTFVLVANFMISEAAFIVTSAFHHENMVDLKLRAEGKPQRQKRKLDSAHLPQMASTSRKATNGQRKRRHINQQQQQRQDKLFIQSAQLAHSAHRMAHNASTNSVEPAAVSQLESISNFFANQRMLLEQINYQPQYVPFHNAQPMWSYPTQYSAPPAKMARWKNHSYNVGYENKENSYHPTQRYPVPFHAPVSTSPVQHNAAPPSKIVPEYDFSVPHLEGQPSTKGPVDLSDWGEFAKYFGSN